MADTAVIAAVTGPGRRIALTLDNVQEISFRLKKKIIEVVDMGGATSHYDLSEVNSIVMNSDGVDLKLEIKSKEEENDGTGDGGTTPEAPGTEPPATEPPTEPPTGEPAP